MPATKTQKSSSKKSAGLTVSNVVKLGINPVPLDYGSESWSYITGLRYIPFLNPNDEFAKQLLECKTLSATHTACIETKKTYCAGQGLYDTNGKVFDQNIFSWVKRINVKGESQLQINKKAFGSLFTFGNVPVEIVRMTVMGKRKLFIYVHSLLEWRLGWPDSNGNVTEAIQSKLFLRTGIATKEALKTARVLPLYNPDQRDKKNWLVDKNGVERTMIWLKNDMDGYPYYGMPSSHASLIYQVNEYKAARYNYDNYENNMVIGGVLALKGNLGQDEANKLGKSIIGTHTGDGKRGRIIVVASEEGSIEGSDFHQYEVKTDGSFIESDQKVMEKIILANEWSPLLAGLPQAGAMGKGNTFLRTEYFIKKKTVIDPAQGFLIGSMWNPIFEIAAAWMGGPFLDYNLDILDIDPVSALADIDPTNAIMLDEVRAAINLPADTTGKGKFYMGDMAGSKKETGKTGGDGNV